MIGVFCMVGLWCYSFWVCSGWLIRRDGFRWSLDFNGFFVRIMLDIFLLYGECVGIVLNEVKYKYI